MSNLTTSTAVFKALLSMNEETGDILTPFEKLTEIILLKTQKKHFNAEDISIEFYKEYNIRIDVLPMKSIFKRLRKREIIEKKKNTADYYINDIVKCQQTYSSFQSELEKTKKVYDSLMDMFKTYLENEFKVIESLQTIEKWFQEFFEVYSNAISLRMTEKLKCINGVDKKESIYISSFIIDVCLENADLENLLKRLTFGYILNKGVFFDVNNGVSLKDLTIVLDTPIIFKAVGITVLNDSEIYKDMIKSFISLGGEVKVFSHTLMEVESILRGAEYWIDRVDYNPLKASLTSEYYIEKNLSKADVALDLHNIRNKVYELGIDEIFMEYSEATSSYNQSEDKISELISNNYNESVFKKDCFEKNTVQFDAQSINGVYHIRKGNYSTLIQSCKAIFVTSNLSLVKASQDYNEFKKVDKKFIPACISDIEIGTFIWLNSPIKIEEISFFKMTSQVLSIMEPSTQLWNRFILELEKCEKNKEITPENCYLLRSHSAMSRELMKLTLDDIEFITSETPNQILNKIKNDVIAQEKVKTENEINDLKTKYNEEMKHLEVKLIEEASLNKSATQWIKNNLENKVSNFRKLNYFIFFLMYSVYCYILIKNLIISDQTRFETVIGYIGVIAPICYYILSKYIHQIELLDKVIDLNCEKYREKLIKGTNIEL